MDRVFKALADPTRRLLLDRLREDNGQTLGQLCEHLDMARQSVTQHLSVLESTNLVSTIRRGRMKLHYLNPVPLHEIQDRWIQAFEYPRLQALGALKQKAEEATMADKPTFVYVTYIQSTAEKVWEALTDADLTAQYWGHRNVSDWRPGSPWQHQRTDGSGIADIVGEVIEAKPPHRLVIDIRRSRRARGAATVVGAVRHRAVPGHRCAHRHPRGSQRAGRLRGRIGRMGGGAVQSQIAPGNRARVAPGAVGDARRTACRDKCRGSAITGAACHYPGGMPHPIMFRDHDFGLAELRKIALGFPEAFEKISWGRPVFCAPKIFVMYGGNAKGDTPGEMTSFPYSMLVKVDASDRRALEADTRFFFPAYMGPVGLAGAGLHCGTGGLGRGA